MLTGNIRIGVYIYMLFVRVPYITPIFGNRLYVRAFIVA